MSKNQPSKAEIITRRKRVIEYYETTAHRSKALTIRHFAGEIPRESISRTLKLYELRKKEGWTGKWRLRKDSAIRPEMMRKYEELYRMDPQITDSEAQRILNIKTRPSVVRLRQTFHAQVKAGGNDRNLDVLESWCLGENRIESSEHVQLPPPLPPVPKKVRKKIGLYCHCLACFKRFKEIHPAHRNLDKLKENLKMMFAFKYILDMSAEQIEELMRSSWGGSKNPSEWVIFCEDCQSLVDEAMKIHGEIRKLEKTLKGCKNEILQRMCDTSGQRFKSKCTKGNKQVKYVGLTKKVREIVCSRERIIITESDFDFTDGDKQAEIMALARIPPEVIVKQETEDEEILTPVDHLVEFPCDLVKNEDNSTNNPPEAEADCNENSKLEELESPPPEVEPNILEQVPLLSAVETDTVPLPTITLGHGNNDEILETAPGSSHGIGDILEPLSGSMNALDMNLTPAPPSPLPTATQGICDVCGVAMRPLAIPMHKLKEHNIVMEGYTAKYCKKEGCNYKTLYEDLFKKHVKKHSRNLPFNCSFCGKGFVQSGHLKSHEEIHKNAETRPYQCDLCGTSFAVKNYLYMHKRMSHDKRSFPSTNRKRAKE